MFEKNNEVRSLFDDISLKLQGFQDLEKRARDFLQAQWFQNVVSSRFLEWVGRNMPSPEGFHFLEAKNIPTLPGK